MISTQFIPIIKRLSDIINHEYKVLNLKDDYQNNIQYNNNFSLFLDGLLDKASRVEMSFIRNTVKKEVFRDLVYECEYPVLTFYKEANQLYAVIFYYENENEIIAYTYKDKDEILIEDEREVNRILENVLIENHKVFYLLPVSLHPIVSDDDNLNRTVSTPMSRLFSLMRAEKKDIAYIYFYAIIISFISLSLPVGIQSIIEMISGGVFFNAIVILIALVIVGIIVSGALQVMQYNIVEIIQRRIFVKAAFELSTRIPRFRTESLNNSYVPELINRFFDVLTIQKSLPKILIDITQSFLQIGFGIILLSFYHPFFIIFGIILAIVLGGVFYFTGPVGLRSSLIESKYKYRVAHWLEELARAMNSFKLAGHTHLPMQKTDYYTNNYIHYRKKHFTVLMSQFISIIAFKTVITGGLLIIGTWLVIDRQITLGQFVATEVVIILILASVEKLILSMSSVYDVLTAVEKIGNVTDLPLERKSGVSIPHNKYSGMEVKINNLQYKYPNTPKAVINGINLHIKSGERICIAGYSGSGKNTFAKILAGLYESYQGSISFNGISLRDINLNSLRDSVAKNVAIDDVFDGTIFDNISMGKSRITYQDIAWALESVGMVDFVNSLSDGLMTEMAAGGKPFSSSVAIKMIVARCIAEHPQMLILNDVFHDLEKDDKLKILDFLLDRKNPWTLVCLSNDPLLMKKCDRILIMKDGKITAEGTFTQLSDNDDFQHLLINPFDEKDEK
jgi:ABC-type bacteriocin/lantibiotic exporter with double-glycine peptidase domain